MKRVILENESLLIQVCQLNGSEIVAYKAEGSNAICLLSRLDYGWGFIALNGVYGPCFKSTVRSDSIRLAASERRVYAFGDYKDFAKALHNNLIQ